MSASAPASERAPSSAPLRCAPDAVRRVAVLGTGSVGASWAALFLAHDMEVVAFDPAPGAEDRARDFVTRAWPALREIGAARVAIPPLARMRFAATAVEAVHGADLVQENVLEYPDLKTRLIGEVDAVLPADVVIASSTGGVPPSQLQAACRHPARVVVLHPFNPAHLMPLVEVVGGERTAPAVIDWAMAFARRLGKQPVRLHREKTGHMTNRLQFALVREAVACYLEGMASAEDIDRAVRYGLAPRWALMGSLATLHLAGGAGGMRGILEHTHAAIEQWWTPSAVPALTPDVIARLAVAGDAAARGQPIADWVRFRDAGLVEVVKLQQALAPAEPGAPS